MGAVSTPTSHNRAYKRWLRALNARDQRKMRKRIFVSDGDPSKSEDATDSPVTQGDLCYDYSGDIAWICTTGSHGQAAIFTAVSL